MKKMEAVNFSIQLQNCTVSQPRRPQPEGLVTTVRSRYGNPQFSNTLELQLSGTWLSGNPITLFGLALPLNMYLL